jgi:CheY-like chemotaxis protein
MIFSKEARHSRHKKRATPTLGEKMTKNTILIVDDDKDTRDSYQDFLGLGPDHYEFAKAENGAEGKQAFDRLQDRIFIVLTDRSMPVMDGDRMVQEIRKTDLRIPILMITGDDIPSETRAMVTISLKKPFEPALLIKLVREAAALR